MLLQSKEFEKQMSSFYMASVLLNNPYYESLKQNIIEILTLINQELNNEWKPKH